MLVLRLRLLIPLLFPLVVAAQEPGECPHLVASGASADLYCIHLYGAPGIAAGGWAEMRWIPGPFTVAVSPEGTQRWNLEILSSGVLPPLPKGRRPGFVIWAAPPSLTPLRRLGVLGAGATLVGPVTFDRFLLLISAESDTTVDEMTGRVVLRGESAGDRMRPADTYQFFLGAMTRDSAPGMGGMPGMSSHDHHAMHGAATWEEAPMFPGLDMLPSEMALRPAESPWLPPQDSSAPIARPRDIVKLKDGDTLDLAAGVVNRAIAGRSYTMFGFNGQYPGPLISVTKGSRITVRLRNNLPLPTTVHWHGIRLDNQFDGVPDETHPAVAPGGTFTYQLKFPDEGLFWYHPHVREDIQQDLGLYGNIFVAAAGPATTPVRHEEFLILDDLLIGNDGLVPYGATTPTHAAMGRFGNVMLVNGETNWQAQAKPNETIRLYLTNVSNTRTFNLSLAPGATMQLVGSDQGEYATPVIIESVVIAPAERYIVDVQVGAAGTVTLLNRVRAIDHLYGRFFGVTDTLGAIRVAGTVIASTGAPLVAAGRESEVTRALLRANVGLPPQHTLELSARFSGLPFVSEQLMRLDSIYFNPVEWEGTMPGMNYATTGSEVHWILRDRDTGAENMDIRWSFKQGDMVRLRLVGTRNTLHGMHHPIHIHGQRFLVLAVNGTPNENPVWKDTVLLPAAGSLDLLVEMSNPGSWMLHCHIAEHLQAGMMMHFDVEKP